MNKFIAGGCIIAICCFSACANKEPDYDSTLTNTDTSKPVTIISDSQNLSKRDTTMPGSGKVIIPPLTEQAVNQTSSTPTKPGMNPPHGQPNHRCDIAVGAPLNSPIPKSVTPPVSTTTNTPAQNTTGKTVTPSGMNPPHGEPGHRCDIAVGASLNLPVTKLPSPTIAPVPEPAPVTVPPQKVVNDKNKN